MNVRQTAALKWTFYALAALLLCFLRRLLLGSALFWGVLPFLPPVLLAVVASVTGLAAVWAVHRAERGKSSPAANVESPEDGAGR